MGLRLFEGAFALYALSTSLALAYLHSKDENLTLWMWRLLGVALFAHLASFALSTRGLWLEPENRYFLPVNTFFGALSWLALANALIFWIVEGVARLHILGAFVLPWTCLASAAALAWAIPSNRGLEPALRSYWMNIHPMILLAAYAAFANAFGVGLALIIQERQVKSRKPSELCYRLPAIEDLDRLHHRILLVSLPVLTLGLVMGGVWAYKAWGRFWGWDAKETASAVTWTIYAVGLLMRFWSGMRGRKSVYVSMAGFASIVFTFFVVSFLSQRHAYLLGPR